LYAGHHPGATALADQHLGGVVMLLVGGGSYLVGALWLTGRLLRADGENSDPGSSFSYNAKVEPGSLSETAT
jgi:hypothetical protein